MRYPTLILACLLASCASPTRADDAPPFAEEVLAATSRFQSGGGYDTSDATKNLLTRSSSVTAEGLNFELAKARPSFCSAATYLVFLQATQQTIAPTGKLARALTVSLDQQDGHGVFGRWNANGPGCAKLVADLACGLNFSSWSRVQRGDFMKIWWTEAIGGRERGHHVVYLSHNAETVTFWSSNQPSGYGTKTVPRERCKRVLFTRITRPERIANAVKLPAVDPWLASMLRKDFTWDEVVTRCRVIE